MSASQPLSSFSFSKPVCDESCIQRVQLKTLNLSNIVSVLKAMFGKHVVVSSLLWDTEFHMHLETCPDMKVLWRRPHDPAPICEKQKGCGHSW